MMRQVPWESWQQWHYVRSCFFSNSPIQISQALHRVSAWRSRGGLPVAVEITAELLSIQQRDPNFTAGVSPSIALPGEMLRMMYSMAIMRLVNGVVDQSVKRNTSSVANRAEAARLPRVFVDIRHETSHNELPSLPLVRHASKQALAWLQRNYWEEQELLLPDTQDTLKTKLIEHAQMILEILTTQQRLISEEGRGQDHRQRRLLLKRALKSVRRQQQALLRELLELVHSGASDLVHLLVKHGLLVHDLKPSCSSPTPRNERTIHQCDNHEVDGSPPASDDLRTVRHVDKSVVVWRHTVMQLAEHLPHLPALLLFNIIEVLTGNCTESSVGMEPNNLQNLEKLRAVSPPKEELVDWALWILDQSSALSRKKAQMDSSRLIQVNMDIEMQAVFPQDTLKELAQMCLRSNMDKELVAKLISGISPLLNDSSFRRRAQLLARSSLSFSAEAIVNNLKGDVENVECGSEYVVRYREPDSVQIEAGSEEFTSDTALLKARELQQGSLAKWVADRKASRCMKSAKPPASAGTWSKVKNWTPCAIGMLPHASDSEAFIPQFDFDRWGAASLEVVGTGKEPESRHDKFHSVEELPTPNSEHENGRDLKRKANEAETENLSETGPKRNRLGEDHTMSEEVSIAGHNTGITSDTEKEMILVQTDNTSGMEHDSGNVVPMDEDHVIFDDVAAGEGARLPEVNFNSVMEPRSQDSNVRTEEVMVTWQGFLLQRGVLQLSALQELPNLQAAIRVL